MTDGRRSAGAATGGGAHAGAPVVDVDEIQPVAGVGAAPIYSQTVPVEMFDLDTAIAISQSMPSGAAASTAPPAATSEAPMPASTTVRPTRPPKGTKRVAGAATVAGAVIKPGGNGKGRASVLGAAAGAVGSRTPKRGGTGKGVVQMDIAVIDVTDSDGDDAIVVVSDGKETDPAPADDVMDGDGARRVPSAQLLGIVAC